MLKILKAKFEYLKWDDSWYAILTPVEILYLLKNKVHLRPYHNRDSEIKYYEEKVKNGKMYSTTFYMENTKYNREIIKREIVINSHGNKMES